MSEQPQISASSFLALHSKTHKDTILNKFDTLRKRDVLCDITLIVEDTHFKAHKALLAASSEYFSLMFTAEGKVSQSVYKLDGMAPKTFAAVLEFIYSADVSVEESATEQLLDMARFLEIGDLLKAHADQRGARPAAGERDAPKRKRGRPRKAARATAASDAPVGDASSREEAVAVADAQAGSANRNASAECAEAADDSHAPAKDSDDGDYDPREDRVRHSRRKVKQPVKLKGYRLGEDAAGEQGAPGKRGRKRKYPDTEARCEDCGKVFKNHLFLKIHQRTHTGEKPFRCFVCGKGFTQKHTLQVHQRMHTGEKPYVCTVCSKALSTKHSLQEHMNLHTEQKSFSCDQCGKTYSQKRQLKSHYRVHTGKALPECAHCQRKFMDAAQLKKHLRTHTGEKPFTCEVCGKCFTAKSTLQTHIRIHRGEKPYACGVCSKSFSDPSARRRHVTSHTGKKPFTCSLCSLSFARVDNLKAHAKTHNKERPGAAGGADGGGGGSAAGAEDGVGEVRGILQQYQLPHGHGGEQEIQLVVTGDVDHIDFGPGQEHPGISILAQPAGHVQSLALVAQDGAADPSAGAGPHVQTISVLEGGAPEQMHVITLTKEAMEQLQAHHHHHAAAGCPPQLQLAPRGLPAQLHVVHHQAAPQPQAQAIHVSSQAGQPISISQTSEQIPSHQIQGQTFQIQAGTVSYLYTTSLAQQN